MKFCFAAGAALALASGGEARPLSASDRVEIRSIPRRFTTDWERNDKREILRLFAPDAVFIPHDGVRPHRGRRAISQFWFPAHGPAGTVTSFTMTVEGVSGSSERAIVWGKSNLQWQDKTTAYRWPGYYLMGVTRDHGRWLITHLMSSDEQPTKSALPSHP